MAGFQVLHGEHQNNWDKDGCSSAYFFSVLDLYLHLSPWLAKIPLENQHWIPSGKLT